MPWRLAQLELDARPALPSWASKIGTKRVNQVSMSEGMTEPPPYLKEFELIELMDRHGIGTDASMATHVGTIVARRYVTVRDQDGKEIGDDGDKGGQTRIRLPGGGKSRGGARRAKPASLPTHGSGIRIRHMVPTVLGSRLVEAFLLLDESLVRPALRASMESQVALIADGNAEASEVLSENLDLFRNKFRVFQSGFDKVFHLFDGSELRETPKLRGSVDISSFMDEASQSKFLALRLQEGGVSISRTERSTASRKRKRQQRKERRQETAGRF